MVFSTIITADYPSNEPSNESRKIFRSFDGRYYDEIIARMRLQAIDKYQYGTPRQHQREKLQQEEGKEKLRERKGNIRILLVDNEPDICIGLPNCIGRRWL